MQAGIACNAHGADLATLLTQPHWPLTWCDAPLLQHRQHHQGRLSGVGQELVGVPPALQDGNRESTMRQRVGGLECGEK